MMKKLKKTLSLILALVMCLSLVNLSAFAVETGDTTAVETPAEEVPAAVQAFLDAVNALPESVTEENAEEVAELVSVCEAAYSELSEEDLAREDVLAACEAMAALMDGVDSGDDGEDEEPAETEFAETEPAEGEPAPQAAVSGEMASDDFLAAAADGVITLDGDVTLSDALTIRTAVTIDLNGHTLSSEKKITFFAPQNTVCELKNGTVESGIIVARTRLEMEAVKLTSNNQFAITMGGKSNGSYVAGSLELVNCTITKTGTDHGAAIGIYGQYTDPKNIGTDISELKASGKTTITGSSWGIMGNGSRHGTNIELGKGVTVTGSGGLSTWDGATNLEVLGSSGIYHPQQGTLVTSADISGIYTGIEMRAGELTVNGGSITATTEEPFACDPNSNGTTTRGAAIAIAQHTTKQDITVMIKGGTFTGVRALNESNPQKNDPEPQVNLSVNDGTFIGEVSAVDVHQFIKGGTFSYDVSKNADGTSTNYVDDLYVCHRLEKDGQWWNVHEDHSRPNDCYECKQGLSASKGLYVSATGSDAAEGTRQAPFATLAHAVGVAPSGATIYVLSDLEMNACARYWGKSLTIKGVGATDEEAHQWTVIRGEKFAPQADNHRSWYNPAMIEVDGSLRLESLIFDDMARTVFDFPEVNKTTGTGVYTQEGEDGKSNLLKVQDAIVATYDGGDEVTLGNNVELRNFGGMSAVRLSAGKLTMERGSKIVGGKNFTTKGSSDAGVYGAAGAVWMQGGELVMEQGSFIGGTVDYPMYGRAVYLDGGKATVNGTISNIAPNIYRINNKDVSYMWQGSEGVAAHVRNGGQFTLGSTGVIDGNNLGAVAVQVTGNPVTKDENGTPENVNFYMENGSVIKDFTNMAIHLGGGVVYMDGELTNVNASQVINLQGGVATIGPNGNIHNNRSGRTTIYFQTDELYVYGKIHHNYSSDKSGGIEINNNTWGTCTMYPGAEITDNYGKEQGAGVMVCKGTFTMLGGLIARNVSYDTVNGQGGGVCVRRGGQFVMIDGEISNNAAASYGGGVACATDEETGLPGLVDLRGGKISGNKMGVTIGADNTSFTGGTDNDLAFYKNGIGTVAKGVEKYLTVSPNVTVNRNVYMSVNNKIVTVTDGTKLGNASGADNDALKATSKGKGWSEPLATFWAQNTTAIAATVKSASETSLFDENLPVYVLVKGGDKITSFKADLNNGVASFNAPASTNGVSIALVQPGVDYGTLTLVADPVLVKDNEVTDGKFAITYTLTYEPSDNVLNSIKDIAENITLDVAGLSVTKAELEAGFSKTWTVEDVPFVAGASVEESARLNFTLGNTLVEVPSNLVVTRMENRPVYTVTYDLNGGTSTSSELSFAVSEGDSTPTIADPTREGYTFTGWSPAVAATVTGDVTYTAQWRQNGSGGGTPPTTDIEDEEPPLANVDGLNNVDHFAYVAGYPDGNVRPEQYITRAEAVTIFYRLMTEEYRVASWATSNEFTDSDAEAWYNCAVSTAAKAGILKGDPEGTVRPNDSITRAEFAAIAARFISSDVTDEGVADFADTADHWAAKEIRLAVKAGWINGVGGNRFEPDRNITRAEVMALVNRMLDRVVDKDHMLSDMKVWPDNMDTEKWYYADVQEATNDHEYERMEDGVTEQWTKMMEPRNWNALEQAWIANNGADPVSEEEK